MAVALNRLFYATSFSLFVFISLNLLNLGKKYLNTKYNFCEIKTFICSKTLLEIFIITLILRTPCIVYYKIFLSPSISDFFNNNNLNSIWDLMKILNLYSRVDPIYLFLAFSGRALARFFMFVKVFRFVDKTQGIK
ncbi:hypothetical protein [Paramaledivibacter caminithermalis]|nr:hypothetical protein [Paramaledivibacter caminithermalis]